MPLVRFEVRNEYKLGGSHLYKEAVLAEDPKPVLDGVVVAGLVGILRQLGDLAEFAAEVFHGLQEQVASTSSRSRKLATRVQRIEASLPQLEKAILSQTSHIHYAYTPGCSLHARIRNTQNHFIYDDLPSFIMDSYEECREPPRLQLLDRFDTGGPGSCLKRYSDPTFFRRASASSEVWNGEKSPHGRKTRKMKRRRTRKHAENYRKISPFSKDSERMQSHTESTVDTTCKSDVVDSSDLGSKDVVDYIECELHPSTSVLPGDANSPEPSSLLNDNMMGARDSIYVYGQNCDGSSPSLEETAPHFRVTGNEKMVSGEHIHLNDETGDLEYIIETKSEHDLELKAATAESLDQVVYLNGRTSPSKASVDSNFLKKTIDEIQVAQKENVDLVKPKLRLVDASVKTEDSSERESITDSLADESYPRTIIGRRPDYAIDDGQDMVENHELHKHDLGPVTAECIAQVEDFPKSENTSKLISKDCLANDSLDRKWETIDEVHYAEPRQPYGPDRVIDNVQYMLENVELPGHGLGPAAMDCIAQVEDLPRGESSSRLISNESPRNDSLDQKWETIDDACFAEPRQLYGLNFGIDDVRYMLENFEPHVLDLGPATTECRAQVEELSGSEDYSEMLSDGSPINTPFERKLVASQIDDIENNFDTVEEKLENVNGEPVSQMDALPESESAVTVIEWNQLDDVDSETDQFVDALNTIESESESDFEGHTRKELISYSSCKDELVEYAEFVQKEDLINHHNQECEFSCPFNDDKENDIKSPNAIATSINMESLGHAESSFNVSVAAMISLFEPEHESDSVSFHYKEEVRDPSSAVVPMKSIEHEQSSNNVIEAEISQATSLQELERECDSVSLDNKEQPPDASLDSNAAVFLDSKEQPQPSCDVSAEDISTIEKLEVKSRDVVSDQNQQISGDSHNSAATVSSTCLSDEQSFQHIQSSCDASAEEIIHAQKSEVESCDVVSDQNRQISDDARNSAATISSTCLSEELPVQHIQSSCDASAEEITHVQKPEVGSRDVVSDQNQQISDYAHNSAATVSSTWLSEEPVQHIQSWCYASAEEITCVQKPEVESHDVVSDQNQQISDYAHNTAATVSSTCLSDEQPAQHSQSLCDASAKEIAHVQKPEVESHDVVSDQNQQISDDAHNSAATVSSTCLSDEQTVQHIQSSSDASAEEIACFHQPEVKSCNEVSDQMQQLSDDSCNPAALLSFAVVDPLMHAQSSGKLSAAEEGNELDRSACFYDEQSVQHIQSSSAPAKETVGAPHLSQGISLGASSTHPPAFWTNGTLFGLQPSKPPVLSSPNPVNSNPISKTNIPSNVQRVENSAAGASSLKDPGCGHGSVESNMGNQDAENFNHCSQQISGKQHEKPVDHDVSNLRNGRITHHEVKASSIANVKNVSTGAIITRQEKPSLITLLGRELLRNGLKAGSFEYADKSSTTISMSNELENRYDSILHSTPETMSKEKMNSPVSSPPPSPPLDHMKISFRPIDGFGTSRLKLKYPEGIDQNESIIDSFPSFQLVPEPSDLKADIGSDSDDDTFCRSYACMSDDYLNHLSDSNSDEWESGETSESNDPALYDGLRRISSTEFASSSPQCEETDQGSINVCSISGHVRHPGSAPSFHLPTLGSQIPFSYKESTVGLDTEEIETPTIQKPTPETPPFPPVQWRISEPLLDAKDKQGPTIADLSKWDSAKQFGSKEPAIDSKTNELDEQQLDPQRLNNEMTNVGGAEDKDDFLNQIRTKSLNLRRTQTSRSSYMQNNTSNIKVTAILQKANAIRQAVASDGEDDSWSDT